MPDDLEVESIVSFSQDDADDYRLTVTSHNVGGLVHITMHSFEAIRLYNLVVKAMVGYVTEMEIAKASYERGEGPNGEAPGTWGPQSLDAYRCVDPEGDFVEEMRYQADVLNKRAKENR